MGSAIWEVVATGVVLVGGGLLVPAGVAKLASPDTVRAATNLPGLTNSTMVRFVGIGELLLAVVLVVDGAAWTTAALAATYLAFAVVAAQQRRRGADCGCFGAASAPTGWSHVGIDLGIALGAVAATATGGIGPVWGIGTGVEAVLTAALLVAAVAGVQQLLTGLPALAAARREEPSP